MQFFLLTKNCNFTEVGEPVAEQPLAVAVQQGSHLVKLISKTILELQKERYFEQLTSKKQDPLAPLLRFSGLWEIIL